MKFRSKKLLVTGGAGFIGSNFISHLLENYDDLFIYNLDLLTYAANLNNTNNFNSNKRYKFIHGDICDEILLDKIFKDYNIDGVINFAAESHVDNSINNPDIFIRTNIYGVHNLLKISYLNWFEEPHNIKDDYKNARFHQISTDEVYGSIDIGSFVETDKHNPNSPYSASKSSADMLVRSYNKTYGLNTTITCSSNNYGFNQNGEKFIPLVINSLINNRDIPVYGDGKNIRDWIFVHDNCLAIDKVFNKGLSGEVYNIGSNKEYSNLDVINIISDILKIQPKIKFVKDRFGHDRRYSLCIKKIQNSLKWFNKSDFRKKLEIYINKDYE